MDKEKKSRSQIKREMQALQKIGERLCTLSENQLKSIDIPKELQEAVLLCKSLTKKAKHRQMQYIGVLMRHIDTAPVLQALEMIDQGYSLQTHRLHQIEQWRDEMLDGNNDCIERFFKMYPDVDRQHIRQLVRNSRKEKESGKPPRSSRLLFRYLAQFVDSI